MELPKPLFVRWLTVAPCHLPETQEIVLGFYSSTNSNGNLSNVFDKVSKTNVFSSLLIFHTSVRSIVLVL